MNTRSSRFRKAAGFTLIEVLVALAVFMLLAVLLMSILGGVSRNWQQAQSNIKSRQSGRSILDYISREMEVAALPANRAMIYASPGASPQSPDLGLQFVENPPQITSGTFLNPHALFWQAPIATDISTGGMAEVGYFVRWDTSSPQNPRAILCRFFVNPTDPNYLIYANPTAWLSDAILDAAAPGVKDPLNPGNSYKGWFADNVIGMWARCLDARGNTITTTALGTALTKCTYDSRKGFSYVATSGTNILKSGYTPVGTTTHLLATLPPSVEVALVILDSAAASRLTQIPAYPATALSGSSFWTDINKFVSDLPPPVKSGARIYSTRITLKNAR